MRVVVADALGVFREGVRSVLLRVLGPDGWTDIDHGRDPGPGTMRNALAGALFAGGAVGA